MGTNEGESGVAKSGVLQHVEIYRTCLYGSLRLPHFMLAVTDCDVMAGRNRWLCPPLFTVFTQVFTAIYTMPPS